MIVRSGGLSQRAAPQAERLIEIAVSALIVVALCILLWFLFAKAPAPINTIGQLIVVVGGCLWLITHLREIVHAIAGQ